MGADAVDGAFVFDFIVDGDAAGQRGTVALAGDGGEDRGGGGAQREGPGQRDIVWAVDLGPYDRLIIDAAWFPGTPAQVKSEIETILRSMAAGHWG